MAGAKHPAHLSVHLCVPAAAAEISRESGVNQGLTRRLAVCAALAATALALASSGATCAIVSRPAAEAAGGVRAGRPGRCTGADHRADPLRWPGPARDRGESPRRRRHHRSGHCRQGRRRRLHLAGLRQLRRHQPARQQAAPVQHRGELHAHRPHRQCAQRARRASVRSGRLGAGTGRVRQGAPRSAHLRLRRRGHDQPPRRGVRRRCGASCKSCTYPTRAPRLRRSTC